MNPREQAFEAAGYELVGPGPQWSAIKPDRSAVAITVWDDEIDKSLEPWVVNLLDHPRLRMWIRRKGNIARREHIRFGLENCSGKFELILCRANDTEASVRKVDWARPLTERMGVILAEDFRAETGEFRMTLVPRDAPAAKGPDRISDTP